jgi:hypothetical protein
MATTIIQSFKEYASNLEITDRQTSLVSQRRQNVVDALGKELILYPGTPSRLIGSYDRSTLIRYLSEGDVDVMVVLHYSENKDWDNPEGTIKVLDKFKSILDDAYPKTEKRRDQNCISMTFSQFRLDIVPAFKWNDGSYRIPDSIRKKWLPTDPTQFADKITSVNKNMGGSFVPLIKMVKAWNRDQGYPLRSFHLECIMYNHYCTYNQGYTYNSMLKLFFESLQGSLSFATYEPVTGDRVDTYLDNFAAKTRRQIAIEKAQDAAAKSKEAFEDEQKYSTAPIIAISEWKILMGEFFPSYA